MGAAGGTANSAIARAQTTPEILCVPHSSVIRMLWTWLSSGWVDVFTSMLDAQFGILIEVSFQ